MLLDNKLFLFSVCKLQRAGTYAGNDAIVAFARRYSVNVIIHQLCAPLWIVSSLLSTFLPTYVKKQMNHPVA